MAAHVARYDDAAAFWHDAQSFLERDEAGNTQLLAIASRHAAEKTANPPRCYAVRDNTGILAAAALTDKGTLFLTPADPALLQFLHAAFSADGRNVTDIVAEEHTAWTYAALLGIPCRIQVGLRLYRLDEVVAADALPAVPGTMRQADNADFDLLCAWQQAFLDEVNVRDPGDSVPELVRRRLRTGGAWLWEVEGTPVAHAGYRDTPVHSARIAPVYTPAALRGHGYASALVAAMSRRLLAWGKRPLYLFADMDNPTANGVYCRVGFVPIGAHLHLTREEAPTVQRTDEAAAAAHGTRTP